MISLQPDPGYYLVLDPEDRVDATRLLHAVSDPQQGRSLVTITPGGNNLHWLARDVLAGLGKRHDLAGGVRNAQENWERTAVWLAAHDIRELFVSRAHLLDGARWERLLELAAQCGLSLWLIAQATALSRTQREAVRDWPIQTVAHEDFTRRFSARPSVKRTRRRPVAAGTAFPEVPLEDFTSFRSACAQLLDDEDFAVVETAFWHAHDATRTLLEDQAPGEELLSQHLRALITGARRRPELVTRVRGAQTACFMAGSLVKVDVERLVTHCVTDAASCAVDPDALEQVGAYPSPRIAAIAVLALAGWAPHEIAELNLSDLTEDGTPPPASTDHQPLPAHASALLRAHHLSRTLAGAAPTEPLFVYTRGGGNDTRPRTMERYTSRAIQQLLRKVGTETGLMLTPHWRRHRATPARSWLHRLGISVSPL